MNVTLGVPDIKSYLFFYGSFADFPDDAEPGAVILKDGKEYVNVGTGWEVFGDNESDEQPKTPKKCACCGANR